MKLFLFDFDGVLVDSLDVYEKTVTDCLIKINQPLTRGREEFLEMFEGNFYESLVQKGVDLEAFMKASVDILAQVKIKDIKPIESVVSVVERMQKNNCLIVISSNNTSSIREALALFGYDDYFKEILGSDFMLSKKDKILYAIKKYQASSDDIYYIGDTTGDIKEGKQAGVKTVGVTWGWHSREKMVLAEPDYLFDNPADLLTLDEGVI
ncbi:MAG: Phosphoglycolate phosphatase [Deltaproteobacteria bacterium ADurb.BinA014]|nr:MAG: Phosphoglycolate phosphatase [Deltaproteobacteria bacterium ADurb.BinA014]HPW23266.1 HAD family hydrolase [Smithellaceae bacterium]